MKLNMSRVIGIYAPQKYGKTQLAKFLAKKYIENGIDVFLYDTDMEQFSIYKDINVNIIKSKNLSDLENQKFFNKTIIYLRAHYTNFLLIIEDIDKLIQSKIKSKETLEIYKLASDSRHQRIAIIYTTKTPSYIPTTLRNNTNLLFFGKFVEPLAIDYITKSVDKEIYKQIKKPEFVMLDVWEATVKRVKLDLNKQKLIELL
jgi:hypothetical protein